MKQAWGKKFKRVGTFCSSIWKKKRDDSLQSIVRRTMINLIRFNFNY